MSWTTSALGFIELRTAGRCEGLPHHLFVTSLASNLRDGLGIADGWLSPICPGLIGTGHELGRGLGPDMM